MRFAPPIRAMGSLLVVACCIATAAGGDTHYGERELLADVADGRLDRCTLLDAAVIASGVHGEDNVVAARRRLDALWLEVGQPLIARLRDGDQARAIFAATHRLILTGKYR